MTINYKIIIKVKFDYISDNLKEVYIDEFMSGWR